MTSFKAFEPSLPGWGTTDLLGFDASEFNDKEPDAVQQETSGEKRARSSTEEVSLSLTETHSRSDCTTQDNEEYGGSVKRQKQIRASEFENFDGFFDGLSFLILSSGGRPTSPWDVSCSCDEVLTVRD